ncbi:MAG TPA: signal peptidase I [Vicinamibacterales bacterium]|nr:signal peptidase I [Vicinamibacterales bacterium]
MRPLRLLPSLAGIIAIVASFGFQIARVQGFSMAPTLESEDRVLVDKLVYEISSPRPGDIVMLYYPLNPSKLFVKRLIATEGDIVKILDGRVSINGRALRDDYVDPDYRDHDDWGPQVIPVGYDFVLGDHRNNSSDSRHWGMVPKKYIVGKIAARWWPIEQARLF